MTENEIDSEIEGWDDADYINDTTFDIDTKLSFNLKEDIMQDIIDVNKITRYCALCDFKGENIHILLGIYLDKIIELLTRCNI